MHLSDLMHFILNLALYIVVWQSINHGHATKTMKLQKKFKISVVDFAKKSNNSVAKCATIWCNNLVLAVCTIHEITIYSVITQHKWSAAISIDLDQVNHHLYPSKWVPACLTKWEIMKEFKRRKGETVTWFTCSVAKFTNLFFSRRVCPNCVCWNIYVYPFICQCNILGLICLCQHITQPCAYKYQSSLVRIWNSASLSPHHLIPLLAQTIVPVPALTL